MQAGYVSPVSLRTAIFPLIGLLESISNYFHEFLGVCTAGTAVAYSS